MTKPVPYDLRCHGWFERRTQGRRYVNRRWQCPRKALKGLRLCSYCEPSWEKRERLAAKKSVPATLVSPVGPVPAPAIFVIDDPPDVNICAAPALSSALK